MFGIHVGKVWMFLCWMVLKYTHSRLLHIIVICNNTKYTLHSSLQCILLQSYYNFILHCKLTFGGGGGTLFLILPFSYSGYLSIKRTNRHNNGVNWFKYEVSRNVKENVKFDPATFWTIQVSLRQPKVLIEHHIYFTLKKKYIRVLKLLLKP